MANFNLEVTYQVAVESFSKKNPEEMASKSGCPYDEESKSFKVRYLKEEYLVSYPEGKATLKGEEVELKTTILLLHYLSTSNGQPMVDKWISFKELPDGFIYVDPFTRRVINPMLNFFGENLQGFIEIAEGLGGRREKLGDVSVTIDLLPKVPVTYVIYEADEEFPASGNVLFNGSAAGYLPTEDYALICQLTILKMKEML